MRSNIPTRIRPTRRQLGVVLSATLVVGFSLKDARADENGVSFWLPGLFGSLAAVPVTPGFSLGSVYYHTSIGASGNVAASVFAFSHSQDPKRKYQSLFT